MTQYGEVCRTCVKWFKSYVKNTRPVSNTLSGTPCRPSTVTDENDLKTRRINFVNFVDDVQSIDYNAHAGRVSEKASIRSNQQNNGPYAPWNVPKQLLKNIKSN